MLRNTIVPRQTPPRLSRMCRSQKREGEHIRVHTKVSQPVLIGGMELGPVVVLAWGSAEALIVWDFGVAFISLHASSKT